MGFEMINKKMIDQFIEVKKQDFENQYSKRAFENTAEYYMIHELFSRLVLEKNAKVSKEISNQTQVLLKQKITSPEAIEHLKNYVKSYNPRKQKIKPWWKFW